MQRHHDEHRDQTLSRRARSGICLEISPLPAASRDRTTRLQVHRSSAPGVVPSISVMDRMCVIATNDLPRSAMLEFGQRVEQALTIGPVTCDFAKHELPQARRRSRTNAPLDYLLVDVELQRHRHGSGLGHQFALSQAVNQFATDPESSSGSVARAVGPQFLEAAQPVRPFPELTTWPTPPLVISAVNPGCPFCSRAMARPTAAKPNQWPRSRP